MAAVEWVGHADNDCLNRARVTSVHAMMAIARSPGQSSGQSKSAHEAAVGRAEFFK
jgi:hypothetical protein